MGDHDDHRRLGGKHNPPPSRIATAHQRQPPDFLIIGAQRGGTTSLYRYLTAHPEVGAALRKEVHFFDQNYDKGLDWYLAHFPLRGEATVVGEGSPYYLLHPDVPGRIRATVPQAKLITLLRNPVDRAYSQYHLNVRRGHESLSLEDAIDREEERLSDHRRRSVMWSRRASYVTRGRYAEQLERWLSVFPREQLLILKSEDLYAEPERVFQQVLAYLNLPAWSPPTFKAGHQAAYPDMDPATRSRLADYFAPFNRQLYALIGRDFGWERE